MRMKKIVISTAVTVAFTGYAHASSGTITTLSCAEFVKNAESFIVQDSKGVELPFFNKHPQFAMLFGLLMGRSIEKLAISGKEVESRSLRQEIRPWLDICNKFPEKIAEFAFEEAYYPSGFPSKASPLSTESVVEVREHSSAEGGVDGFTFVPFKELYLDWKEYDRKKVITEGKLRVMGDTATLQATGSGMFDGNNIHVRLTDLPRDARERLMNYDFSQPINVQVGGAYKSKVMRIIDAEFIEFIETKSTGRRRR